MSANALAQTALPAAKPATARAWPVFRLAGPMTAFFFIQSAVSLASLAMLGSIGDAALAGVGAASAIFGVILALLFGIDAAVQATVSRTVGAGRQARLGQVLAGTPSGSWRRSPSGGGLDGRDLAPRAAVARGDAFRPGRGRRRRRLYSRRGAGPGLLRPDHSDQRVLDRFGPARPRLPGQRPGRAGADPRRLRPGFRRRPPARPGRQAGAGEALCVASFIGLVLQFAFAAMGDGIAGFLRSAPSARGAAAIAAIGWPISLQQALLQFGLMIAFVIVARLGTVAFAAAAKLVLVTLVVVPIQTAVGFGAAAATLVGQSLGRGDAAEARRWGWRTVVAGVVATAPFAVVGLTATHWLLGLFLRDPATLALAVWPVRIVALGVAADTAGRILCFALRGAGAMRIGAAIPFVAQWALQLPFTWWLAVSLGLGLAGMAAAQTGVAVLEAAVTALVWSGARWARRRVFS